MIKNKLLLLLMSFIVAKEVFTQNFNNNLLNGAINHNVPISPEAASFQKYGTIPVNELTGTPAIDLPLFTLEAGEIQLPLALKYHASGIKVNQEATWVGLGWDLNVGGSISLQIRGGYDMAVNQYINSQSKETLKYMMDKITSPYLMGNQAYTDLSCNWNAASVHYWLQTGITPCSLPSADSIFSNSNGSNFFSDLENFSKYGVGEPDIYVANFLGKSISFYFDVITESFQIIGEKSNFQIHSLGNSIYHQQGFTIVDNLGFKYSFEQLEYTYHEPYVASFFQNVPAVWHLTRIDNPSLTDFVNLEYINYGKIFSAPNISEIDNYLDGDVTHTSNRNLGYEKFLQEPYYISRISTNSIEISFVHGSRIDISGDGAMKLDMINVKTIGTVGNQHSIKFNYSYFQSPNTGHYIDTSNTLFKLGIPSSVNNAFNHLCLRLKLNSIESLDQNDISGATHKFFYKETFALPSKVSLSQDHWGYYNGQNSIVSSFTNFVPSATSLISEGLLPSSIVSARFDIPAINLAAILPGKANRQANETYALCGMLDSIIYPTGGSTKFIFELHESFYSRKLTGTLKGGGTRIKTIKHYDGFKLQINRFDYSYLNEDGSSSGIYMGNLDYFKVMYLVNVGLTGMELYLPTNLPYRFNAILYSNGNLNDGSYLVGYKRVSILNNSGNNGEIRKYFNLTHPEHDAFLNDNRSLLTSFCYLPPVRKLYEGGELIKEEILNASLQLKKRANFYYYTDRTNVEVKSLRFFNYWINVNPNDPGFRIIPMLIQQPVSNYKFLPDSVVTEEFDNGQILHTNEIYTYNQGFDIASKSFRNSKNEHIKSNFFYSPDFSSLYPYSIMSSQNLHSQVVRQIDSNCTKGIEISRTNIQFEDLYYKPLSIEMSFGSGQPVTKHKFLRYNNRGRLLEEEDAQGITTSYVWGFKGEKIVGVIKNVNYPNTISWSGVDTDILNNSNSYDANKTEINKLHSLSQGLVSSYTHSPLIGIVSQTNPNNRSAFYEYDPLGRLLNIKDHNGFIIKRFCYNYAGQQVQCYDQQFLNDAQSGSFTKNNCVQGTGTTLSFTIPAGNIVSYISKADANAQSVAKLQVDGQANANNFGTCQTPSTIYARLEYPNFFYSGYSSYADVVIKFYSDVNCTQPVNVNNLSVAYSKFVNGEGYNCGYNYPGTEYANANGTNQIVIEYSAILDDFSDYYCSVLYSIILSNGYQIGNY